MLKKIVEYDYERGILTSLVWLDFQWMDEYLKWNPADYEGITQIQLPPHKLWTPDIFLFNDVTGHFGDDLMRGRPYLVIENNGDVRWIPPMILKTVCEHDNQEESCDLRFGSWVYNAGQLDLRPVNPSSMICHLPYNPSYHRTLTQYGSWIMVNPSSMICHLP